jgi:hypothetical protein
MKDSEKSYSFEKLCEIWRTPNREKICPTCNRCEKWKLKSQQSLSKRS